MTDWKIIVLQFLFNLFLEKSLILPFSQGRIKIAFDNYMVENISFMHFQRRGKLINPTQY